MEYAQVEDSIVIFDSQLKTLDDLRLYTDSDV